MSIVRTSSIIALITSAGNAALFGLSSAAGSFDGVTAAQNGESLNAGIVAVASAVGVCGLIGLRLVLARWRGATRGRRSFLVAAAVILVISFASPVGGLDDGTAGAILTLMATHVTTVLGGVVAAERITKPMWDWGREAFEPRQIDGLPTAVVTGATGGIGGAVSLALAERGFVVEGVGRSVRVAMELERQATTRPGAIRVHRADLSSMRESARVARDITAKHPDGVDVVVHAVGTLERQSSTTAEGIDANIATSWLTRVQFQRQLRLRPGGRIVNVAAAESADAPPRLLADLRVPEDLGSGFTAHGRAQLANDLWVAGLQRDGAAAFGYGPGSVDTGIRRELPAILRRLMAPLFWWSTRRPDDAAADIVRLALDARLPAGGFASRDGLFEHNEHVRSAERQAELQSLAETLLNRASSAR
ncbi:MAG: SDR family NAD(P)-dependent oxidoreductase [Actinomycetota bacterium]